MRAVQLARDFTACFTSKVAAILPPVQKSLLAAGSTYSVPDITRPPLYNTLASRIKTPACLLFFVLVLAGLVYILENV